MRLFSECCVHLFHDLILSNISNTAYGASQRLGLCTKMNSKMRVTAQSDRPSRRFRAVLTVVCLPLLLLVQSSTDLRVNCRLFVDTVNTRVHVGSTVLQ